MSVTQFVDQLLPGESLANDALAIHAHLVAAGIESSLQELRPLRPVPGAPIPVLAARSDADALVLHVREPDHSLAAFESWAGPVVVRDHGCWWTSGCTLANPMGQADFNAREQRLEALYRRAELVLAVSTAAADRALRLGANPSAVVVVPPLFPSDQFAAGAFDRGAGRPSVLVVGRLDPHAGLGAVISAFHLFASIFQNDAVLTIVGRANPSWLHGAINEAVGAYRLNCRLLGHVSQQELLAEYAQATVMLSLSEATGFGVRVAEAMINGLPVVARQGEAGAIAQTLGGAGLLLAATDSELVVAEALHEVLDNAQTSRSMQSQGRVRGEALHASVVAPRIVDALRRFQ